MGVYPSMSYHRLGRGFDQRANSARYARRARALMGLKTGAASWVYDAPGGQGYKYGRLVMGQTVASWAIAFNQAGVADTGDLAIDVDIYADGRVIITKERYNG